MGGSNDGFLTIDAEAEREDGDGVEQAIFMAKQPTRSSDGGTGERLRNGLLAFPFSLEESGRRVASRVEVRDVDQAADASLVSYSGDPSSTLYVHVVELEVPDRVVNDLSRRLQCWTYFVS